MQRHSISNKLPPVWICPECRTLYKKPRKQCDRDDAPLAEVQAHQVKSRYPLLGKVVGDRYHLIGGLGQGGLGTVYLAQHLHLEQLFAVKFLDLETVGLDVGRDQKEEYSRDFMREARVASVIRHESVVRVSDFGIYEKMPFLVMDYVPGPSLLQMLAERGRFEVAEAINIARQIADALGAFHERRLVHRDLKPANVILDPRGDGRLTLVDLGLVKDVSGHGGKASTHPMALRGTPGYLAPEQVPSWVLSGVGAMSGKEKQVVDARADLYALGVLFYEMIAGVSPYPDGSNTQIIIWACTKDPLPLSGVDPAVKLLPGLEQLIYDTMARDPDKRPADSQAFIDRLDEIAMGPAIQGSWPVMVVPGHRGRQRTGGFAALIPQAGDGQVGLPADTEMMPPERSAAAMARARQAQRSRPPTGELPFEVDDEAGDTEANVELLQSFDGLLDDSQAEMPTAIEGFVDDSEDMAPTQVEPLGRRTGMAHLAAQLAETRISRVDLDEEEPTKADMPPMMLIGSGFRLEEPAAPVVEPPARRRRPWLLLLLPVIAIATGWVVWMLVGGDDGATVEPDGEASRLTVGTPQPAPPVPEPVVAHVIQPDQAVVDAAPAVTDPEPERKRRRKRTRRKRADEPRDVEPRPSDKKLRGLLNRGRKAMEVRDYDTALKYYEQWLDQVRYLTPPHPQLEVIKSRVGFLRDVK